MAFSYGLFFWRKHMKSFIGKTGRVLIAVGCRLADRVAEGKPIRDIEAAMLRAVDKGLQKEALRRAKEEAEQELNAHLAKLAAEEKQRRHEERLNGNIWPQVTA